MMLAIFFRVQCATKVLNVTYVSPTLLMSFLLDLAFYFLVKRGLFSTYIDRAFTGDFRTKLVCICVLLR